MIRLCTMAVVAGLAASASADFFFIGSEGDFVVTGGAGDVIEGDISTTVGTQFGPYAFEVVEGSFSNELGDPDVDGAFSGTYELFGPNDGDILTIEASGVTVNGIDDSFFSYTGTWTVTGASGAYEGLTGAGDLSGSSFFDGDNDGFASLQIQGVLVPTPAGLALLGMGGLFAARRRR